MTPNDRTDRYLADLRNRDNLNILFVCLGNICRSPAAEGVMRALIEAHGDLRITVDSAGTGGYHIGDLPDKRMRLHARYRGYELTHRARKFSVSDFDNFDLIVVMDDANRRDVMDMARTIDDETKIVPMAHFVDRAMRYDYIPDPYYEGADGFELVLDLLEDGTRNLYNELTPNTKR